MKPAAIFSAEQLEALRVQVLRAQVPDVAQREALIAKLTRVVVAARARHWSRRAEAATQLQRRAEQRWRRAACNLMAKARAKLVAASLPTRRGFELSGGRPLATFERELEAAIQTLERLDLSLSKQAPARRRGPWSLDRNNAEFFTGKALHIHGIRVTTTHGKPAEAICLVVLDACGWAVDELSLTSRRRLVQGSKSPAPFPASF